jgi:predicted NAD/FAD-binding protein
MSKRIAIVGTGISGLGAAWALHPNHDIVVYESADRLGGHSNTVDIETRHGTVSVDTGFIVYNEVTYPHLTRLFETLGVATEASDMSFSFSRDRVFEYGASLGGVLGGPANLLRPRFRRMLLDINRFRRIGAQLEPEDGETIESLLRRNGFSPGFLEDYLLPMTGAIWSTHQNEVGAFPAQSILQFLSNHGLIEVVGRPPWRTVSGGSRSYVNKLSAPFADRIRLNSPVQRIVRTGSEVVVETRHGADAFDEVVLATHSDQALRILGSDASERERSLLAAIPYEPNTAYLHSDPDLMPRRRSAWSSWNSMAWPDGESGRVASVTYWMNRLQNLDPRTQLFVSLNPGREPNPALVHGRFEYAHPQFDLSAVTAQREIAAIQGHNHTWFAGAYLGYGFHEDGLQSGFNVAAALGSPPPWFNKVTPKSSALPPISLADAS